MSTPRIPLAVLLLLLGACTPTASTTAGQDTPATTSTSGIPTTSTVSTTVPAKVPTSTTVPVSTTTGEFPSTTSSATTSSVPPSSTTVPDDPSPGQVGGVLVAIGAGSGEIDISWDRNQETDIDHYEIWWSEAPGGSKDLIGVVPHDPAALGGVAQDAGGGRTLFVDLGGRNQIPGHDCYRLRAVDLGGNGGPLSTEVCLPNLPPSQVAGLSVELGGGSGEVAVIWQRNAEPDIDHYEIWYSAQAGGTKSLLVSVPHDASRLPGNAQDLGDGRTLYIDAPRELVPGTNCYQVAAVDDGGVVGPRSGEVCFQP